MAISKNTTNFDKLSQLNPIIRKCWSSIRQKCIFFHGNIGHFYFNMMFPREKHTNVSIIRQKTSSFNNLENILSLVFLLKNNLLTEPVTVGADATENVGFLVHKFNIQSRTISTWNIHASRDRLDVLHGLRLTFVFDAI